MVLPVAGGSSGEDTEVAVRTNHVPLRPLCYKKNPTYMEGWMGQQQPQKPHWHDAPDLPIQRCGSSVDHPKALPLMPAERHCLGRHMEQVRDVALL